MISLLKDTNERERKGMPVLRAAGHACHGIIMSASVSKQTQKQCVPVTADSVGERGVVYAFQDAISCDDSDS